MTIYIYISLHLRSLKVLGGGSAPSTFFLAMLLTLSPEPWAPFTQGGARRNARMTAGVSKKFRCPLAVLRSLGSPGPPSVYRVPH